MSGSVKTIFLMAAVLFIVVALGCVGFYFYQQERLNTLKLQDELEEVKTRQRVSETRLEESLKTIADLKANLLEKETQLAALDDSIGKEKNEKLKVQADLEQVRFDLQEQKQQRTDLENRLRLAQEDLRTVKNQLGQLQINKAELESRLNELQIAQAAQRDTEVELGTIVVNQETGAPRVQPKRAPAKKAAAPAAKTVASVKQSEAVSYPPETMLQSGPGGLEAKVLVVNKDYNFVVMNMGSKDGVRLGDLFSIYRSSKFIGDVKVEKVHDSMAAAGFVTPGIREKVAEGDRIVRKGR